MFAEFGPAPLCLELDFDTFEGPPHWVARLRQKSGWLMVAEATIQSEHDMLTERLVVACDEQESPIPPFKALNLLNCNWINPTYCAELPPEILEELICEEERALIARWHRDKNSALAEAFEEQEARIAEVEGRAQFQIAQNEAQIAELRQRRRHPSASPEMRRTLTEIIREIDQQNDDLLDGMVDARAAVRAQAAEFEETLWDREDLLIEVTPLHLVRWTARPYNRPALLFPKSGAMGTISVARAQKRSLQRLNEELEKKRKDKEAEDERTRAILADRRRENAERTAKRPLKKLDRKEPKRFPAVQKLLNDAGGDSALDRHRGRLSSMDFSVSQWPVEKLESLRDLWLVGVDDWKIGKALGGFKASEVRVEAAKIGLPARECWSNSLTNDDGPETTNPPSGALQSPSVAELRSAVIPDQLAREYNSLAALHQAQTTPAEGKAKITVEMDDVKSTNERLLGQYEREADAKKENTTGGSTGWTEDRVALLKQLWLDGQSAATIAKALGSVSRNAVIGKAARLKLPRTRGPSAPSTSTRPAPETDTVRIAAADAEASPWSPESIELLETHWLDGTPAEEIARVLGLRRSQVIGKAHRLGLSNEARPRVFDEVSGQQPPRHAVHPEGASVPASVQNALSALSAARKRYYGQD